MLDDFDADCARVGGVSLTWPTLDVGFRQILKNNRSRTYTFKSLN